MVVLMVVALLLLLLLLLSQQQSQKDSLYCQCSRPPSENHCTADCGLGTAKAAERSSETLASNM